VTPILAPTTTETVSLVSLSRQGHQRPHLLTRVCRAAASGYDGPASKREDTIVLAAFRHF